MSSRGLSAPEFAWEERNETLFRGKAEVLVHRPTGFYFAFEGNADQRHVVYSPGSEKAHESGSAGSWPGQYQYVIAWLNNVKREVETPDPWSATFRDAIPSSGYKWEADNSPFTEPERQAISAELRELEVNIFAKYKLSDEDKKLIDARLNYLEDATKRQNRKDWVHTAIGVAVTIGFSFATSPQLAKDVLTVVSRLAQVLLGGGFPQLTP